MVGYIKDHRKELDSEIWAMPPLYHRVWQYLKYKANHHEADIKLKDGSVVKIQPGQHLTSIKTIAKDVGWMERGKFFEPNKKTISTVLNWMKEKEMIDFRPVTSNGVRGTFGNGQGNAESNALGTLITLVNWAFYQISKEQSNGFSNEESNVSDPLPGTRTIIINNNTTNAHARDSSNLSIENQEINSNPLKQILDAYCSLHGRMDIHIRPKEREIMGKMIAGGVPSPFIITTMAKLYEEKRKRDVEEIGRFQKPGSFKYYEDAIWEAWINENAQTSPVPSGTVAPGKSRYPQAQVVPMPKEFVLDEEDEITKLMRKVSGEQLAEYRSS